MPCAPLPPSTLFPPPSHPPCILMHPTLMPSQELPHLPPLSILRHPSPPSLSPWCQGSSLKASHGLQVQGHPPWPLPACSTSSCFMPLASCLLCSGQSHHLPITPKCPSPAISFLGLCASCPFSPELSNSTSLPREILLLLQASA